MFSTRWMSMVYSSVVTLRRMLDVLKLKKKLSPWHGLVKYFQRTHSVLSLFYELIAYLWLQVEETNQYLNCLLTRIYKLIYFTIFYMPRIILYTWFYLSVLILLKTKCLLKVLSCSDTKLDEIIKEKNKDVECNIVADGIEK